MELFEVLLATTTLKFICEALVDISFECIILWCDSKCVLGWIRSTHILPAFVQKRITEIRKARNVTFRYVNSKNNSADLPTRGMTFEELRNSLLWWTGPSWLNQPELWPNENFQPIIHIISEETPQVKTNLFTHKVVNSVRPLNVDPSKYSTYRKFIRILGHVIDFCSRHSPSFKNRIPKAGSPFVSAEKVWILQEQKQHYSDVIDSLKNRTHSKQHPLTRRFRLWHHTLSTSFTTRTSNIRRKKSDSTADSKTVADCSPPHQTYTRNFISRRHRTHITHHSTKILVPARKTSCIINCDPLSKVPAIHRTGLRTAKRI